MNSNIIYQHVTFDKKSMFLIKKELSYVHYHLIPIGSTNVLFLYM